MQLFIENNEKEIKRTNYYDLPQSENYFYLSMNAGALRLLIPKNKTEEMKNELEIAEKIIVTFMDQGVHLLLEDNSQNPYQLFMSYEIVDRKLTDHNRKAVFYSYIHENGVFKLFKKHIVEIV